MAGPIDLPALVEESVRRCRRCGEGGCARLHARRFRKRITDLSTGAVFERVPILRIGFCDGTTISLVPAVVWRGRFTVDSVLETVVRVLRDGLQATYDWTWVAGTGELELLTEDDARSMLQWPHGGFHVNYSVRLEADDACGILHLARYSARAPVSLERLRYDERKEQVALQSDKREGPTAGTHVFSTLEFLAMLLVHVPDTRERLVREYGAYSTRRRARWRRAGVLTDTRTLASASPTTDCAPPDWPALRAMRQRWAELLQRIYEVDPLRCRRCGGEMRIIAFILDADVIAAILRHMRSKGRDPRALPEHAAAAPGRAPPLGPPPLPLRSDRRLTRALPRRHLGAGDPHPHARAGPAGSRPDRRWPETAPARLRSGAPIPAPSRLATP